VNLSSVHCQCQTDKLACKPLRQHASISQSLFTAFFTARRYAYHYAVARCPSVCLLSLTRRYCVETYEHIIILFTPSGSHIILVFSMHITRLALSRRGVKCRGMKNCDCRPISRFISLMKHQPFYSISMRGGTYSAP